MTEDEQVATAVLVGQEQDEARSERIEQAAVVLAEATGLDIEPSVVGAGAVLDWLDEQLRRDE